jgi:hypothetical protein
MAHRTITILALVLLSAAAFLLARGGGAPGATEPAVPVREVAHGGPAAVDAPARSAAPPPPELARDTPRRRAPAPDLRGRVTDAWHWPVAGASVQLLQADQPIGTAETAADGRFLLARPPGGSPVLTLVARDPRWAPAVVVRPVDAPGCAGIDVGEIALLDGGGCAGRVLDEQRRPCLDARLTVEPVHGPLMGLPAAVRAACIPEQGVDAEGRFVFAHLTEGACVVVATAPGRQRATSPRLSIRAGEVVRLEPLVLAAGCALQGQVFDPRGRPVAGAGVDIVNAGADPAALQHATTDACGAFLFAHLPPAPHHLRVVQPGCRTWVARDLCPQQTPSIAVHLQDGGSLAGRVVDAGGQPLPSFRVRLVRSEPPPDDAERARAREHARLQSAAGAQLAGGDPATLAATLQALAELERERRAAIRAREPFGPASGPQGAWTVVRQEEGRFAFAGLDDVCWAVEVEVAGRPAVRTGPVALPPGSAPAVVEVAVPDSEAGPGRTR